MEKQDSQVEKPRVLELHFQFILSDANTAVQTEVAVCTERGFALKEKGIVAAPFSVSSLN